MDTVEVCRAYWRHPSAENTPECYIPWPNRSRILVDQMLRHVNVARPILEVGCNVGRNLAALWTAGYRRLTGLEINPDALMRLREVYPELSTYPMIEGDAEEVLPRLTEPFGCIYTMAVLEHFQPGSRVFSDIARLGQQVLAIEPLAHNSGRSFPHDIPAIFQGLGMDLMDAVPLAAHYGPGNVDELHDYIAWWFVCAP